MEEDNNARIAPGATLLSVKAWTAYIGPVLMAFVMLFVLRLSFTYSEWLAAGVLLLSTVVIGYRVLLIRSVQLYCDDVGVWMYAGILPWARGVQGVKWRDLDEATFVQSFWSWLFRSYSIRIGHRFTKSSEILLSHMARGKQVVAQINERHQQLIRGNTLN
ncbi:hypothetical protein MJ904_05645 [Massilia sp. MB5]|uniref:hypothetical protein n=1 Tax=unclassified Massilia TaxID=2609279 RepID=UPI00067BA350|nr:MULTISPECIES: hypothetical protein [unclassified Massilia]AKU23389.1 hypothetical protein ACZ75_19920 [Massilia sp. NR 4-1]UMR31691.1 hypothetical protein MJ904_05645 [Massilia sp. MB5]